MWRNVVDQTIFCLTIVYYPLTETKTYIWWKDRRRDAYQLVYGTMEVTGGLEQVAISEPAEKGCSTQ